MKLPPQLNRRFFTSVLAAIACLAALGSCGGGGGGGNSNPPLSIEAATTSSSAASSQTMPTATLANTVTTTISSTTTSTSTATSMSATDSLVSSTSSFIPCAPAVADQSKITNTSAVSPFAGILPGPGMAWLAGGGFAGNPDGQAALARFSSSQGMTVDRLGNVYLSENTKHTIRKISPQGIVSTLAGQSGVSGALDGQGTQASFNTPSGIAVDSNGNVFVADTLNRVIRKISSAGAVSTFAGTPGVAGNLDGESTSASFINPTAITIDPQGNLYVVDDGQRIRKIDPSGIVSTFAGTTSAEVTATTVVTIASGYGVPNEVKSLVARPMINGKGSAARFASIGGITSDLNGNLYVTDNGRQSFGSLTNWQSTFYNNYSAVRKITPNGEVSTFAGSIEAGTVFSPYAAPTMIKKENLSSITSIADGSLIVQDVTNKVFQKISPSGIFSTASVSLGNDFGHLQISVEYDKNLNPTIYFSPSAITSDHVGNLYYFDDARRLVVKSTSAGAPSVIAGEVFYLAYDGVRSRASISGNRSWIAVDTLGNLYVNNTVMIRRISSGGLVTTVKYFKGSYSNSLIGIGIDENGAIYTARSASLSAVLKSTLENPDYDQIWNLGSRVDLDVNTGEVTDFVGISAIHIDAEKNIFLADEGSIRKVTPKGVVSTCAGLTGKYGAVDALGLDARFSHMEDFAIDSKGNIFVLDTDFYGVIRKISPNGVVSTFAGSAYASGAQDGVGTAARFHLPTGIAIDRYDNLYVLDSANFLIRKITPNGVVSTVAGIPRVSETPKNGQVSPLTNGLEYMRSIAVLPTPVGVGVSVTLAITMTSGVLLVSLP